MKQQLNLHKYEFQLAEQPVQYPNGGSSYFYTSGDIALIIDDGICNIREGEPCFSYSLITDKQNEYISKYRKVYRILREDMDQLEELIKNWELEPEDYVIRKTVNREESANISPLEFEFEQNFVNVYGSNSLKYLSREYGIRDEEGNNYFLDYLIHTKQGKLAVEENGISYHHPQIIGIEKYRKQLMKQNTCVKWGIKLYRFSSEDCQFQDRIEDDILRYFGEADQFVEEGVVAKRSFKLYEHQEEYLQDIKESRENGQRAFLIVLPTAAGKSKIIETDLRRFAKEKETFRALILAPTVMIMDDWKARIQNELPKYESQIKIQTYSHMGYHYQEYNQEHFDYIVIDEAHHAVAPTLKRVIQYFTPQFLIGLTATDQRLDNQKLENIFGAYQSKLSLTEAMEKKIVATARAYRIETNVDLSKVRFNGKEYVNADLEKCIRVTSRNELIADVLKKYFDSGQCEQMQGLIFCVNIKHAKEMERILNEQGLSAKAVASTIPNASKIMQDFKDKKFRFLCSCNMISEGWDYPEINILVMARPTMSKVLYMQQLGRGLRKIPEKDHVYVLDVVDQYGSMVAPCSLHSIFKNSYYVPFGEITKRDYVPGEMIEIDGICEKVQNIMEIDIDSFEDKYEGYISTEQLARVCYVSTGTVNSWLKKGKISPTVSYPFGSKKLHLFSPTDVKEIMKAMGCTEHTDETMKKDFLEFIDEKDYTFSYKMVFMLSFFRHMNSNGEAKIEEVLGSYVEFYKQRLAQGLKVDRENCPYKEEYLENEKQIRQNMLTNPFEKYERKRFLYYSKELGMIALNHVLVEQLTKEELETIKETFREHLQEYYKNLGGLHSHSL